MLIFRDFKNTLRLIVTLIKGINLMKTLVIGAGGREHALAWRLAQGEGVEKVFVAPGNAGMEHDAKIERVDIGVTDIEALVTFAQKEAIALTVVGPEAPLVAGIKDAFDKASLVCFGPSAQASKLEGSKAFCKDFLKQFNIPTADYACFSEYDKAVEYLATQQYPLVIKADGLAAGKGVVIVDNKKEAISALKNILLDKTFGTAGATVVIEQFLTGVELSFMVVANGDKFIPLASSQDHKRRDNHDKGPNTGGMGAFSPSPILTPTLETNIIEKIIQPTLNGMLEKQTPYVGFLYAGLMISPAGEPYVLEFNCRMGDPETQPILLRMKSDLATLLMNVLNKQFNTTMVEWDARPAVGVVMAAKGYPFQYPRGDIINGLPECGENTQKVFFAGVDKQQDRLVTNGGRVLSCVALGDNYQSAQESAYQLVKKITWDNTYYRTDIADSVVSMA